MIIERILVDNFMSFYGKSELVCGEGLNFVIGPSGSGKSNLWKACVFAIIGRSSGRFDPLSGLINNKHREETSTPSCRAEVEFTHEGKRLSAACSLKVDAGEVVQSHRVSLDIDNFAIPAWTCLYVDAEMMDQLYQEHKEDWSTGKRWAHLIMKNLQRNAENVKSAIIDGAFEYLNPDYPEKILTFADELPMEQLIVMVKTLPGNLQNHPHTIHQIEYDPQNLTSRIVEN